jgi:hypothetical protein
VAPSYHVIIQQKFNVTLGFFLIKFFPSVVCNFFKIFYFLTTSHSLLVYGLWSCGDKISVKVNKHKLSNWLFPVINDKSDNVDFSWDFFIVNSFGFIIIIKKQSDDRFEDWKIQNDHKLSDQLVNINHNFNFIFGFCWVNCIYQNDVNKITFFVIFHHTHSTVVSRSIHLEKIRKWEFNESLWTILNIYIWRNYKWQFNDFFAFFFDEKTRNISINIIQSNVN